METIIIDRIQQWLQFWVVSTMPPPEDLDQEQLHLDKLDWENMDGEHLGDLLLRARQPTQVTSMFSDEMSASTPPDEAEDNDTFQESE